MEIVALRPQLKRVAAVERETHVAALHRMVVAFRMWWNVCCLMPMPRNAMISTAIATHTTHTAHIPTHTHTHKHSHTVALNTLNWLSCMHEWVQRHERAAPNGRKWVKGRGLGRRMRDAWRGARSRWRVGCRNMLTSAVPTCWPGCCTTEPKLNANWCELMQASNWWH